MLVAYVILRTLCRVEKYLRQRALRLVQGTSGMGMDKTLEDIEILYDSPHFIIANKSCDVLINWKDQNRQVGWAGITVQKQVERLYPDLVNPSLLVGFYFCHRLDYATSGVLCIAKHKKACSAAVKAFEERKAKKFYLAIVRGWISQNFLTITEPIGDDTRESFRGVRMATQSSPHCAKSCRDAKTNLVVLEKGICYGYPATKVLMRPLTGRRHQLRLHCSSIGHTIVGDFTYSNRTDLKPYRMFLHAFKLVLPNRLEHLDITTNDPFTITDDRNRWLPKETVYSMQDAIRYLEEVT